MPERSCDVSKNLLKLYYKQHIKKEQDMAKISTFVYCDSINTELTPDGPRHQLVNPLQVLSPVSLPGNFSFAISCGISGLDRSGEYTVKMVVVDPDNVPVYDTGELKIQLSDQQVQESSGRLQFNLDLRNIVLTKPGEHSTKVFINNKEAGAYDIEVVKREINIK